MFFTFVTHVTFFAWSDPIVVLLFPNGAAPPSVVPFPKLYVLSQS